MGRFARWWHRFVDIVGFPAPVIPITSSPSGLLSVSWTDPDRERGTSVSEAGEATDEGFWGLLWGALFADFP